MGYSGTIPAWQLRRLFPRRVVFAETVMSMKSVLVIVAPIVLVTLLGGLIYLYSTGMIEEMFAQTKEPSETAAEPPEEEADAGKAVKRDNTPDLSDVDISTPEGLLQARDIVRASLETQKREELDRRHRESRETKRIKKLENSMDGWLKRID